MSKIETDNLHLSIVKDTNGELVYDWMLDTGTNFEKVDAAVGNINTELTSISSRLDTFSSLKFQKVEVLPDVSEASSSIIYLVPNEEHGEDNIYDEYILVDNTQEVSELEEEAEPVLPSFELIGSTYINPASFKVHFSDKLPDRAEDGALYAVNRSFYINEPSTASLAYMENYISATKQVYNGTFNAGDSLRSHSGALAFTASNTVCRVLKLKTTNDSYLYSHYKYINNNNSTYFRNLNFSPYLNDATYYQANAQITNLDSPLVSQTINSPGKLQVSAYAYYNTQYLNRYRAVCVVSDENDIVKYVSVASLMSYIGKKFSVIPSTVIKWDEGKSITTSTYLSSNIFNFYYDKTSINQTSDVTVYANYRVRLYYMYDTANYNTTTSGSYRPRVYTSFILEPILENGYDLYTYSNNSWVLLHGQAELFSIKTELKNEIETIKSEFNSFKSQIESEIEQRLSQVKQYDKIISFVISDSFDSIKHLNGLDLSNQPIVNVSWYSNDTSDNVNNGNFSMNNAASNIYYNIHYIYNGNTYSTNESLSSILSNTLTSYNPQYSITSTERARLDALARVIFTNPYYAYTAKYNSDALVETNISINGNRFASIMNRNGVYGLKYKIEIGNIICEVVLTTDNGILLYKVIGQTDDISLDVQTLNIPQEFVDKNTEIDQDNIEAFGEHFMGTLFYKKNDDNYVFDDARYFVPNFWQYSYYHYYLDDPYDPNVDLDGVNPYNTLNGLDYTLTAYNVNDQKVNDIFKFMLSMMGPINPGGGELALNSTRSVKSANLIGPREIEGQLRLGAEHFKIKDLVVVDYFKYYNLVCDKYNNNELKTLDDVVALLNECSGSGATAIGPDGKLYNFYYTLGYIEPEYLNESGEVSENTKRRSGSASATYTNNKNYIDLPFIDQQDMVETVWTILQNLTMTNISFVPLCDDRQTIKDAIQIISDDIGLDNLIDEEYPQNTKGTILDRLDDNEFFIGKLVNDVYDDVDGDTVLPQVTENTEFPAPGDAESELDDTINGNTSLPIESIVESKDCITVVDELPEIGVDNALYRVKSTNVIYKCIKSIVESIEEESDEESEPEYQYDFEEMPDATSVEGIVNNIIGEDRYLHIVHLVGNSSRYVNNALGYLKWHSDISFVFENNISTAYSSSANAIFDYLGVSGQGETSEYKPLLNGKVYTYRDATSGDTFKSVVDISYRLDLSYTDANDKVYYGTIPYIAPSITNNYAFVSPTNINPTPLYAEDGSIIVVTKKNNVYKNSSGDDITVTETSNSNGTKNSEYVITNNIKMNGMTITLDNTTTTTDIYPGDFNIIDKVIKL